jgi:hypothetical protein
MPSFLLDAWRRTRRVPVFALVALSIGACAAPGTGGDASDPVGVAAEPITAQQAITLAEQWVTAKLLYCQSPNGASDTIDPSCPAVCMRMSNPQWDPYRSDCSGLVSWAWGLPSPGRTTAEFAPNQNDITSVIAASTLQTGDAVNTDDSVSSEHHIMLFKAWTVQGQTATFIEEPGCSANPNYAHEFTSNVTINGTSITVAYNGITFKAIRYSGLSSSSSSTGSGPPPPTCTANGVAGTCIDTSVCSTMPGYISTPGLCPGPASEQCCTPTGQGTSSATSGTTSSTGVGTGSGSSGSGSGQSGATSSSATGAGAGGATGNGGASYGRVVSTRTGCQISNDGPTPPSAWIAFAIAAGLVRRRKPRARTA